MLPASTWESTYAMLVVPMTSAAVSIIFPTRPATENTGPGAAMLADPSIRAAKLRLILSNAFRNGSPVSSFGVAPK